MGRLTALSTVKGQADIGAEVFIFITGKNLIRCWRGLPSPMDMEILLMAEEFTVIKAALRSETAILLTIPQGTAGEFSVIKAALRSKTAILSTIPPSTMAAGGFSVTEAALQSKIAILLTIPQATKAGGFTAGIIQVR